MTGNIQFLQNQASNISSAMNKHEFFQVVMSSCTQNGDSCLERPLELKFNSHFK